MKFIGQGGNDLCSRQDAGSVIEMVQACKEEHRCPIEEVREVDSDRNSSLGLCQCEHGAWKNLQKGSWNSVMSPYEDRILDVELVGGLSGSVTVTIEEDLQRWRLLFLAFGIMLLLMAPIVSSWVPFYYSSSMAIGVCLVIIVLLFQVSHGISRGAHRSFFGYPIPRKNGFFDAFELYIPLSRMKKPVNNFRGTELIISAYPLKDPSNKGWSTSSKSFIIYEKSHMDSEILLPLACLVGFLSKSCCPLTTSLAVEFLLPLACLVENLFNLKSPHTTHDPLHIP
ncbi:hypothetical protein CQW23_02016 [Capsicum baccatum]|uniref:Uncharacterized protein n=1 Tax=Capsicum baccatum TaxID=33114 RepID=A0A2G2XQ76_CAPBA|nr:hypothetical protein CQW23_02016 [Capsicum baccatum]